MTKYEIAKLSILWSRRKPFWRQNCGDSSFLFFFHRTCQKGCCKRDAAKREEIYLLPRGREALSALPQILPPMTLPKKKGILNLSGRPVSLKVPFFEGEGQKLGKKNLFVMMPPWYSIWHTGLTYWRLQSTVQTFFKIFLFLFFFPSPSSVQRVPVLLPGRLRLHRRVRRLQRDQAVRRRQRRGPGDLPARSGGYREKLRVNCVCTRRDF